VTGSHVEHILAPQGFGDAIAVDDGAKVVRTFRDQALAELDGVVPALEAGVVRPRGQVLGGRAGWRHGADSNACSWPGGVGSRPMLSDIRDLQLLAPELSPTLPAPVRAPAAGLHERIRVPAADGFRAFAALSVVLYHCMYGAGLPLLGSDLLRNYLMAGFVGVDFFLVLSGFLLFLPVAAARGRFGDVRSYALRRVARILPAYYVALVATVGLLLFLSRTRAYGLTRHNLGLNLLLHATFLQHNVGSALGLPEGFGINGAVWTLSIEALFYAILPLVAVGFFRRPVIGLGLGLGIAPAWRLAVVHSTLPVASLPGVATPAAARVILITQFPSYAGHFALD